MIDEGSYSLRAPRIAKYLLAWRIRTFLGVRSRLGSVVKCRLGRRRSSLEAGFVSKILETVKQGGFIEVDVLSIGLVLPGKSSRSESFYFPELAREEGLGLA